MLQNLINFLYRYPKARLKKISQFGGFFNYWQMIHNRRLMKKASENLPPVISYIDGLPVYFLTGKDFLYQTLFCIQSLSRNSTERFSFILIDDGSFTPGLINRINLQLPKAQVITSQQIAQNLEHLPENRYPVIWKKRREYPHIKKLTDVHTLPGSEWKLVLDADMLFWNEPTAMLNWLKNPDRSLHMVDCNKSYGYSDQLMQQLAGTSIPQLLNVGAIGLNSNHINWDNIENWIVTMEEKEGTSYYLEQALSAMLVRDNSALVLDADQYIVNPSEKLIAAKSGILHHYVDLSKKGYYNKAWRKLI